MARREIDTLWDRQTRNDINENFKELYDIYEPQGYLEDNRGVDYPLRSVTFTGDKQPIADRAKDALLDVKVYGAKIDCYYRLTMVANGYVSGGKPRYGITLQEVTKEGFETTGGTVTTIFSYTDGSLPGNENNANWEKQSDGIETITVDDGEIAVSVTVDRAVISNSSYPEFLNINSAGPTSIIDPSNYFF